MLERIRAAIAELQQIEAALIEEQRLDKVEKGRLLLEKLGLEVRQGHKTHSTGHRDWQSDGGEPWTVLLVPNGTPVITCVSEWSNRVCVCFEDESEADWSELRGFKGETLEEALEELGSLG